MPHSPQCTVVICTRERPNELERCLESLSRLRHPDHEVLIIDNSEGDPAVRTIAHKAGARYILEPRVGLSAARNTGARHARGDIVAFTDDDTTVDPDWLTGLVRPMDRKEVTACTGRVLLDDTPGGRAYAQVGGEDQGERPFTVSRTTPNWFEIANFGGLGVGPNMAFRRRLFDRGFRFPEHLGHPNSVAGEEHFALFKVLAAGGTVAYTPDAVVRHHCVATVEDFDNRRARIVRGASAYMIMLMVEASGYRVRAARYVLAGVRGRRRAWRRSLATRAFASRAELVSGFLVGVGLYLRNVGWERRRHRHAESRLS